MWKFSLLTAIHYFWCQLGKFDDISRQKIPGDKLLYFLCQYADNVFYCVCKKILYQSLLGVTGLNATLGSTYNCTVKPVVCLRATLQQLLSRNVVFLIISLLQARWRFNFSTYAQLQSSGMPPMCNYIVNLLPYAVNLYCKKIEFKVVLNGYKYLTLGR